MEWDRPSRADHYQMATAFEIRYFLAKQKPKTLEPMRLRFRAESGAKPPPPKTAAEATARARSALIAASGGRFRVRLPDGTLVDGKGRLP